MFPATGSVDPDRGQDREAVAEAPGRDHEQHGRPAVVLVRPHLQRPGAASFALPIGFGATDPLQLVPFDVPRPARVLIRLGAVRQARVHLHVDVAAVPVQHPQEGIGVEDRDRPLRTEPGVRVVGLVRLQHVVVEGGHRVA